MKAQTVQKPHKAGKNAPATTAARESMALGLARGGLQVKEATPEHPISHFH